MKPTNGPLRRHPRNPRYFADRDGNPVYLTGSHTWATIQEAATTDPPEAFDWDGWLAFLTDHHHSFTRLWMWEHPRWGSWWPGDYFIEPLPWARTGPGKARDGKPRFDLSVFDADFFERLRTRVEQCAEHGVYVSVMLFQGWSSCDKPFEPQGPNPWHSHPFHADNNVNDVDVESPDGAGQDWVHTLRSPEATRLLEAYIRKTVDVVGEFDHVIYEVANECDGTIENTAWQYHVINYIREYERVNKSHQRPVLMTAQYPWPNNTALFASDAEAISPFGWRKRGDQHWETDPPAVADRVVMPDTDHIWGVGGTVDWVWKTFTRGHNPLYMDPWDYGHMEPRYAAQGDPDVRRALGQTRLLADRIDLATMVPHPELSNTRYVLADPGREYVVYQPAPGHFGLDLTDAPGDYVVTWWPLVSGSLEGEVRVEGGAPVRLTEPGNRPGAAHLRRLDG